MIQTQIQSTVRQGALPTAGSTYIEIYLIFILQIMVINMLISPTQGNYV